MSYPKKPITRTSWAFFLLHAVALFIFVLLCLTLLSAVELWSQAPGHEPAPSLATYMQRRPGLPSMLLNAFGSHASEMKKKKITSFESRNKVFEKSKSPDQRSGDLRSKTPPLDNENNATESAKNGTDITYNELCANVQLNGSHTHQEYSTEGYPFEVQRQFPKLNGTIVPASSIKNGSFKCEHSTCIFNNLCVDHSKKKQFFTTNDIKFSPYSFSSKRVEYKVTVEQYNNTEEIGLVKYVNGTTHFFVLDFSNWFFTLLKTFSLHRTIQLYTGEQDNFNLMIYIRGNFVNDLEMPFVQLYRAIHPTHDFIYDLEKSLGEIYNVTCFSRVVLGYEFRGVSMTGFAGKHLNEILEGVRHELSTATDQSTIEESHHERLLEVDATLSNELRGYKRYLLRQFNMLDVPMKKKLAIFVARKEARTCTQTPYRVLLNRDELVRVLENEGFDVKVVDFVGMSVPEQIEVSRQAHLFVAMHGAGVTNVFWMHRTACILELHTYGFQKWGYETLAHYLKIPYVSWVNSHEENARETWHSRKYSKGQVNFYRSRDQIVDVEEFRQAVRQAKQLTESSSG